MHTDTTHLNIRATLMQTSWSLRWFSRIKQRVEKALLDRKEGRDSDWSAIFLKAAVTYKESRGQHWEQLYAFEENQKSNQMY